MSRRRLDGVKAADSTTGDVIICNEEEKHTGSFNRLKEYYEICSSLHLNRLLS